MRLTPRGIDDLDARILVAHPDVQDLDDYLDAMYDDQIGADLDPHLTGEV